MDIKERFYQKLQESREQLDELTGYRKKKLFGKDPIGAVSKRAVDRMKVVPKNEKEKAQNAKSSKILRWAADRSDERPLDEVSHALAKRAEHGAAKVYHRAYDQETDDRRDAITKRTPEAKKKAEESGEKRKKAAKRVIRFQKYADKKKMNEEEQLDELSDPTHMSYRAKARNQLDKMVNRLGSKIGSDTVNTKKMRNRAEGIKKSYKLQPKKK